MSKATEIKAVLSVFNRPDYEELDEISAAEKIRSALLAEWKGALREAPPVLREGLAFKFPWSATAYHVAYMNDELAWITENSSRFGGLIELKWSMWSLISRSSAKSGGAGENEKGWKVGEIVSFGQNRCKFRILQTHAKCVLMEDELGRLQAEPNDIMESFRRVK